MPKSTGAMSLVNGHKCFRRHRCLDRPCRHFYPSYQSFTSDKKIAVATTNAPALLSGIGEGIKAALVGTDLEGIGNILGDALGGLGSALDGILSTATSVYNFFVNNWGWLAPIVAGITASVTAWKLAMAAANVVQTLAIALNNS